MALSTEFPRQSIDDGRDFGNRLRQEWDDELQLNTTDLLERYRAVKLGLHLHIRIGGREKIETCAVFKWFGGIDQQVKLGVFPIREANPAVIPNEEICGNKSMLIGVVEIVQHPQGVLVCGSPSLAGLDTLNNCSGAFGDALYYGSASGFKFVKRLKNRKGTFPVGCLIVDDGQLPEQMIQGRPQLVCSFASNKTQLKRWIAEARSFGKESDHAFLAVTLYPHAICTVLKRGSCAYKLIEVMHGPFNLGSNSI